MQTTDTVVPTPTKDFPEYWLGQVRTITDMERRGALTHSQMVKEIRKIMEAMDLNDQDKARRAERVLRKEQS